MTGWVRLATRRIVLPGLPPYQVQLVERRRVRRTKAQLAALSDRLLADIGLERSDIARVARYGRDGTNKRAVAELQR